MTEKHQIKISEAKILVYLENVANRLKYVGAIAAKTKQDYGYTLHILKEMNFKRWLRKEEMAIKSYYFLTKFAPIEGAKELIGK